MTQARQHKKQVQEKLRTLNEINRKLIFCKTLEEVIKEALKQVRDHLNVQVASMFLFNKDGYIQRVGIDGVDKNNYPIDGKYWLPDEKYLPGESFYDSFMKDEVVVMEDSLAMKNAICEVIGSIGWQTKFVNNRHEAVEVVKNKQAAYFILDNWIDRNKQEGFDTLEVIRELDEQVFVTIITGYPDPNNEKFAKRLKANLYKEKSADNYRKDIEEIASAMLEHKKQIFSNIIDIINHQIPQLGKVGEQNLSQLDVNAVDDVNLTAYERAKQNSEWLEKYANQYVAFVDGELVDSDVNKSEILKRIRSHYPDKPRFFPKVEEIEEKTIDLSMASWINEIDI